jgi:RNA polymerase sigma-70 factor (ECF subfamily)
MQGPRHFPATTRILVLSAGQATDGRGCDALASLCETYWYPLYAYLRRRGYDREQAQDLTQEFFTRVLGKRTSSALTATKVGSALSFLPR